jgi:hypothetical protein
MLADLVMSPGPQTDERGAGIRQQERTAVVHSVVGLEALRGRVGVELCEPEGQPNEAHSNAERRGSSLKVQRAAQREAKPFRSPLAHSQDILREAAWPRANVAEVQRLPREIWGEESGATGRQAADGGTWRRGFCGGNAVNMRLQIASISAI